MTSPATSTGRRKYVNAGVTFAWALALIVTGAIGAIGVIIDNGQTWAANPQAKATGAFLGTPWVVIAAGVAVLVAGFVRLPKSLAYFASTTREERKVDKAGGFKPSSGVGIIALGAAMILVSLVFVVIVLANFGVEPIGAGRFFSLMLALLLGVLGFGPLTFGLRLRAAWVLKGRPAVSG